MRRTKPPSLSEVETVAQTETDHKLPLIYSSHPSFPAMLQKHPSKPHTKHVQKRCAYIRAPRGGSAHDRTHVIEPPCTAQAHPCRHPPPYLHLSARTPPPTCSTLAITHRKIRSNHETEVVQSWPTDRASSCQKQPVTRDAGIPPHDCAYYLQKRRKRKNSPTANPTTGNT